MHNPLARSYIEEFDVKYVELLFLYAQGYYQLTVSPHLRIKKSYTKYIPA